jgi:hypothetical protein
MANSFLFSSPLSLQCVPGVSMRMVLGSVNPHPQPTDPSPLHVNSGTHSLASHSSQCLQSHHS